MKILVGVLIAIYASTMGTLLGYTASNWQWWVVLIGITVGWDLLLIALYNWASDHTKKN